MSLLAKRYAQALYALATEQGAAEAVGKDLAALHPVLGDPAVAAVITSPDVTATERTRLLEKLTAGRHGLLVNTIGVLQHRRRLDVMFELEPAYRALEMAGRGEVDGVVESALPLESADQQALETLADRLSGKKVSLQVAVRPDLLGGVRLRIGNVLYDGSLRTALVQLEQKLQQSAL